MQDPEGNEFCIAAKSFTGWDSARACNGRLRSAHGLMLTCCPATSRAPWSVDSSRRKGSQLSVKAGMRKPADQVGLKLTLRYGPIGHRCTATIR
jgi:hypothetical protein